MHFSSLMQALGTSRAHCSCFFVVEWSHANPSYLVKFCSAASKSCLRAAISLAVVWACRSASKNGTSRYFRSAVAISSAISFVENSPIERTSPSHCRSQRWASCDRSQLHQELGGLIATYSKQEKRRTIILCCCKLLAASVPASASSQTRWARSNSTGSGNSCKNEHFHSVKRLQAREQCQHLRK